jgi:hypothetical protein
MLQQDKASNEQTGPLSVFCDLFPHQITQPHRILSTFPWTSLHLFVGLDDTEAQTERNKHVYVLTGILILLLATPSNSLLWEYFRFS